MTMKKGFSLLVIMAMLLMIVAACSNNNEGGQANDPVATGTNNDSNVEAIDEAIKDAYEITMAIPVFGAVPADTALVEKEINKIIQPKINATVKLLPIGIGAWQQQLNLMTSGGEKLDTFFSFGQTYGSDVAMGKVINLNDLLNQYGQELTSQFDPAYLDAAKVGGNIYGIPVLGEYSTGQAGLVMRKDLVDKYQIDVSSIHTLDDLDPVFKTIKDNEPGITPLTVTMGSPIDTYYNFDSLGDSLGVLPGYDNDLKIENLYDTQWYSDTLKTLHRWFKAGYINKDAATANNYVTYQSGTIFSNIAGNKVGFIESQEALAGMELVFVPLITDQYTTTNNIRNGLWSISKNSTNPERVMMFLNMMYTDPEVANLLLWGVEGEHYIKVSDDLIEYPEGLAKDTAGWKNEEWIVGNPFITYLLTTDIPDKWTLVKESNQNAIKSKALGFSFNEEPVKNEVTAVKNVVTNYAKALETGTVDPDSKLQEFKDKLKAAGIDKIIDEKQKQLDEWNSNKN